MGHFLGDYEPNGVVFIDFPTYDADGASVTCTGLTASTVKIYKGDSNVERSSSAGITATIDFDSITGVHRIKIDLSDNTDAGFYTPARYSVVVNSITVATQTVRIAGYSFNIKNAPATLQQMEDQFWNADQNNHNLADSMAVFLKNVHNTLTTNVEGGHNIPAILRGIFAACVCKALGMGTNSVAFRNLADTKNRIAATVDEHGNRYTITLDLTP